MESEGRLDRWRPACEAIARLLSPHAEVVLHDTRTDRVLGVWNPQSGRTAGDPSLLSELGAQQPVAPDVYGPYQKTLPDGRRLSSVSAVLRDAAGEPEVMLCVNLDRTPLEQAAALLAAFAAPTSEQPGALFERDWVETVNKIVGDYVRAGGTALDRFTKADRRAVIAELDQAGVFSRKRAVPVVAQTLRAARSTVYDLLSEVRKGAAT